MNRSLRNSARCAGAVAVAGWFGWASACGGSEATSFPGTTGGSAGVGGLDGGDPDVAQAGGGSGGTSAGGSAGQGGSTPQGGSAGQGGSTPQGGSAGTGGSPGLVPSIGTEFWAVDLPNERPSPVNPSTPPSQMPWGVLIMNPGAQPAAIKIEQNDAAVGQTPNLVTTTTLTVAAHGVEEVVLPTREVTGWTSTTQDPPGPPMTFLSSNAYRITSNQPVSVVQVNTLENYYSSDGALLLPTTSLGVVYRVLGCPTSNPMSIGQPMASIPDHASITIVGTMAGTTVKITAGAPILGDGASISKTATGGILNATLGVFDVLNLSSDGVPGDLTGTIVEANHPVAVFTSAERAKLPEGLSPPTPPGFTDNCCTEHIEEQVRAESISGTSFVLAHSAWRSDGGFHEPDVLRLMALSSAAQITTNLPAPFDSFTLQPGEVRDTWATGDAVLSSSAPIALGQLFASKAYTTKNLGDPSFTFVPPVSDHRKDYVFFVPDGWTENHISISSPAGNGIQLDGAGLPATCDKSDAGTIATVAYEAIRCPVSAGQHTLVGAMPMAVLVHGYSTASAWSYAAAGM